MAKPKDTRRSRAKSTTRQSNQSSPKTGWRAFLQLFPTNPTNYLQKTRDLPTSLAFIFPLFFIYQIGILTTGGLVNGVDFVTNSLMAASNGSMITYLTYSSLLAIVYLIAFFFLKRRGAIHLNVFPGVLIESIIYASLLGGAIISVMLHLGLGGLLQPNLIHGLIHGVASPESLSSLAPLASDSVSLHDSGPLTNTIMSIGAGLYEETVFRLILMTGLYYFSQRILKNGPILSGIAALVISSLIFSGIHYVGPLADPWSMGSFIFRFLAGVAFAIIFYFRGFAIAVYTHAIYDILVLVFN